MLFDKLKILYIFFICLLFSLIRGKADKKVQQLKKVLVIQTAKIGDIVCATPMFKAVKEKFPEAKVFVLGNKINQELLKDNQDVDHYLILDRHFCRLVKKIKKEKFDFGCQIFPNFFSLALMYLAGISLIVVPKIENGFSPHETKSYKILRSFTCVLKQYQMGNYAPRENLRLLEPLGIFSKETTKHLGFSQEAGKRIADFFSENSLNPKIDFIVGISPSVGNKIKLWAGDRFAKVADYLFQKYQARIIILGAKNDEKEIAEMVSQLDNKTQFINCYNSFNLDEFKALISKLHLLIGVDTGPIYIAEAFGTPTVDIIGPMNENEQPPKGKIHKIVKLTDRKKPALAIMNARFYNKKEAQRQINEITVDMVKEKVDELIGHIKA